MPIGHAVLSQGRDRVEKKKSAIGTHTQKNRNKGDKSGKDKRQTKQEKLKYLSGKKKH